MRHPTIEPIQPLRARRENRVRAARDGWPVLGPVLRSIDLL